MMTYRIWDQAGKLVTRCEQIMVSTDGLWLVTPIRARIHRIHDWQAVAATDWAVIDVQVQVQVSVDGDGKR